MFNGAYSYRKAEERLQKTFEWRKMAKKFVETGLPYESKARLYWDICNSDTVEQKEKFLPNPLRDENWGTLSDNDKFDYLDKLKELIEDCVGEKGLKRYYYRTICNYTDQQFDDWWESQNFKFRRIAKE